MVHLNIITNMFLQKKIDIAEFQGKNILLIGGYSLKMLLDKNQGEMLFVDFLKLQLMNGGVKSCKIAEVRVLILYIPKDGFIYNLIFFL